MKPSPHDMMVFLEVIESRSFTGAADIMGLTKSAVSHAVNRLEESVGQKLLLRTTRSMTITDAGARILPHCKQLRETYALTLDDLQSMGTQVSETLTVTAPDALCQSVVVPALAVLQKENKNLSVRLITDDKPVKLIDQKIDVAIRVGATAPQTAYGKRVGTLHEKLYASEGYIADMGGMPTQFSDLKNWAYIANDWQGSLVRHRLNEKEMIEVIPSIRCNGLSDVITFVSLENGVAMIPDIAVERLGVGHNLVPLYEMASTPIYALHQYETKVPKKVRGFIKLLTQMSI
ncbi:LysR family transcriptional regulator [Amylibacter sp. SFDW26]|uniref:LysR family transcriptional regulator n=1 Tax=Amylibacter sp. SFDW26 TaxID=2652722 RepID=UPI00186AA1AD|nr:LysR family transcriptional regulator [Amylibacter sp. SFDW26]